MSVIDSMLYIILIMVSDNRNKIEFIDNDFTLQIALWDFSIFTIIHIIGASGFILLGLTSFLASRSHRHIM